jgi:hypothetical protein
VLAVLDIAGARMRVSPYGNRRVPPPARDHIYCGLNSKKARIRSSRRANREPAAVQAGSSCAELAGEPRRGPAMRIAGEGDARYSE